MSDGREREAKTERGSHMVSSDPLQRQVGGAHYSDLAMQPIEFCQRNELGACESLVIKYVVRHRRKNGREDIVKAIHALELLLRLEYDQPASNTEPASTDTNIEPLRSGDPATETLEASRPIL